MIETSRGISHQCPAPLPDTGGDRPKTAGCSQRARCDSADDIVHTPGSNLLNRRPRANTEPSIYTGPIAKPEAPSTGEDAKASPMGPRSSKRRDTSFSDDAKN